MKKYSWILFDADDTLFHFDAFAGLKLLFANYEVQFTQQDYEKYQVVNRALWVQYQDRTISAEQLQFQRFNHWAGRLNVSPHELNNGFLLAMAKICTPMLGAVELLRYLKGKIKMGIITNGFTELQQARLNQTGLNDYFELLVISEQVGSAKPHIDIFEHAFTAMGHPNRSEILMVGDTLESDILGGINAGIDTCWLNAHMKPDNEQIKPTYQITSLSKLKDLLSNI